MCQKRVPASEKRVVPVNRSDFDALIFLFSLRDQHLSKKPEIIRRMVDEGFVVFSQDNTELRSIQLTAKGVHFITNVNPFDFSTDFIQTPKWNRDLRILSFDCQIVKQFKRAAPNQELLLSAFQESGWPNKIDDPLPQDFCVPPEHRLRETVKSLNKALQSSPIRFQMRNEHALWKLIS